MKRLRDILHRQPLEISSAWLHWLLFFSILAIALFARVWEYAELPPGLFTDEASLGVDSYYIGHYGVDRHGVSYPTQLTAFGQEQNALYAYLIMPLIGVFGLKPVVIRVPLLISGLLTLPVVYYLTRRIFNGRLALLSMFFLAISPWHILLSRWGLDQNLLPFVFTLAFTALVISPGNGKWFILACSLFGLCFYIYGPSYFIVPCVLGFSTLILLRRKLVGPKFLVVGAGTFMLVTIPIVIFLLVNTLQMSSVHVGVVTIPRMPSTPRFLSQAGDLQGQLATTLLRNLLDFSALLVGQTDGLIYNAFEPFGYFYTVTFPLAALGAVLLFIYQKRERDPRKLMLLIWLSACLVFGVLQQVNINRINTIFIPLLVCTALAVDSLGIRWRQLYVAAVLGFLAAFAWFTVVYHGPHYRAMIDRKFHLGLLAAMQYASELTQGPICVTNKIDQPYIYALFTEKPDPHTVAESVRYADIPGDIRTVQSVTRYTFGTRNCISGEPQVYVLTADEIPPQFGKRYDYRFFDEFVVYYPRH